MDIKTSFGTFILLYGNKKPNCHEKNIWFQGCSCLCIVIPDKGAQRPLILYPAPLSKGAAFCLCILPLYCENLRNKTLRVLAFALGSGSALAIARWAGMTQNR
jgi:hypothetical protein